MTAMSNAERVRLYRQRRKERGEPDITQKDNTRLKREWRRLRSFKDPHCRPELVSMERPTMAKLFAGCDGEGSGVDDKGRQNYMLLRMGDRELVHDDGTPLGTEELLDFICDHPADDLLVGFSFGYDVTMILRDLPADRLARIAGWNAERIENEDGSETITLKSKIPRMFDRKSSPYTYFKQFDIDYLPRNFFRVRRAYTWTDPHGVEHRKGLPQTARTIWEVFGFFQKSFLDTIKMYQLGTPEEREQIERNKRARSTFTGMTPEVRAYCALECRLLAQAMTMLRAHCVDAGIVPLQWAGAGKLASALHRTYQTPTAETVRKLVPPAVYALADDAYYGGRFEITRVGHVTSHNHEGEKPCVHENDIRSAYPAKMRELPCLKHGKWKRADAKQLKRHAERGGLYIAEVQFDHPVHGIGVLGGLPIRTKDGRLLWPCRGQGTYWGPEIESAKRLGHRIKYLNGFTYTTSCTCKQFEWVERLYEFRKHVAATVSEAAGQPIKLGINALYGKLVQRMGKGRFYNPVWGGLITALVRAMINDAIAQSPKDVVMIATDAVYSLKPLDLDVGERLGQWDHKVLPPLFIVQPGLYWSPENRQHYRAKQKSRGMSAAKFFEVEGRAEAFEAAWAKYQIASIAHQLDHARPIPPLPTLPVELNVFTGLALAVQRREPETAGKWSDEKRTLSFDYRAKRFRHKWDGDCIVTGIWVEAPGNYKSVPHRLKVSSGVSETLDELQVLLEDQQDAIDMGNPFD